MPALSSSAWFPLPEKRWFPTTRDLIGSPLVDKTVQCRLQNQEQSPLIPTLVWLLPGPRLTCWRPLIKVLPKVATARCPPRKTGCSSIRTASNVPPGLLTRQSPLKTVPIVQNPCRRCWPLVKSPASTIKKHRTCSRVSTREESQQCSSKPGGSLSHFSNLTFLKTRCSKPSVEGDLMVSPSKISAKPYKCIICCRPFKYEYSLQLHRQRAHSIVRKLKCLECDQTFETMHNLKVHKVTAHKKSSQEFSNGSDLRQKNIAC